MTPEEVLLKQEERIKELEAEIARLEGAEAERRRKVAERVARHREKKRHERG